MVVVAAFRHTDQRRGLGDVLEQCLQLARGLAVVQRGNDLDRLRGAFEVTLQLGFGGCVEHEGLTFSKAKNGNRKARARERTRALFETTVARS